MQATPAIPYYVTHFVQVLDSVEKQYGAMLSESETAHIGLLRALPLQALCLYVRLCNRKGPYFRTGKLDYSECEPLHDALQQLMSRNLLAACDEDSDVVALLECFTHTELRHVFKTAPKFATKPELCEWLANGMDTATTLLAQHKIIALHPNDPWMFLKFLFFGELTDNLSGFVVAEIGHIVTEKQPDTQLRPQFTTRAEASKCFYMAKLYQQFRCLRDELTPKELHTWWHHQFITRSVLPEKAWGLHDRLIDRLGHLLEREKEYAPAMALYAANPLAPSRARYARLLMKEGRKAEAIRLCNAILAAPHHNEEAYTARQLLGRLEKKQSCSEARTMLHAASQISLNGMRNVEDSVLNYHKQQGWDGIHSENWLWNALFGLLLWDIIYDASYGSFHQPLQMAPSDLYEQGFYERRAHAIEARLMLLKDKDRCMAQLKATYARKQGTSNPFVGWHEESLILLETLLYYVPAAALIATLRCMAQDVRQHCKGFPDLFLWRGDSYQLLEVKSPSDQLSAQQYYWLQFFMQHGVNVHAMKVIAMPESQVLETTA